MIVDAKRKFEAGLLSERDYKIMEMRGKMLDKDAGIA